MGKFLSFLLLGSVALTAAAAPRQLLSVSDGMSVANYEYDTEGKLVKVTSSESVYTFDYSQLASRKFVMTRVDTYDGQRETTVTEMTLNDDGLVVKAIEIEDGKVDDTYFTFDYIDGYLTNYKQISPEEVEETKVTYVDGRITKVENIDGGSVTENDTSTFEYDGIMNPGGLVLYDTLFDIDLDDMEYVAMTGMLGKIYAELPVKITQTDSYGSEVETVKWTVDDQGYATRMVITEDWGSETVDFRWSDSSAISIVSADNSGESIYYTIDGNRATSDTKGILIERRADGTTVKRVNR
ncbi:MAG: DUF4595 domain-containing protein [Bacteroides sp.]|nr:DUF4595 domain-containing protein [Bacteroides sp.]